MDNLCQLATSIILLMAILACTAMEAPTDLTSLAVPESEPESKITRLSQPHIVVGVIALWGCLEDSQKRVSDLGMSLTKLLSNLTR